MAKRCTFIAIIDGVSKWFESYAIDRADAKSQIEEIYTEGIEIEIYCFRHL